MHKNARNESATCSSSITQRTSFANKNARSRKVWEIELKLEIQGTFGLKVDVFVVKMVKWLGWSGVLGAVGFFWGPKVDIFVVKMVGVVGVVKWFGWSGGGGWVFVSVVMLVAAF